MRSRAIAYSGESGERCQPAAAASSISLPYHSAAERSDAQSDRKPERGRDQTRRRSSAARRRKSPRAGNRRKSWRGAGAPSAPADSRLRPRCGGPEAAPAAGRSAGLSGRRRGRLWSTPRLPPLRWPAFRCRRRARDRPAATAWSCPARSRSLERIGDVLPARLVGVEEGALELGPKTARPAADRRRGDEPGVLAPAREQRAV